MIADNYLEVIKDIKARKTQPIYLLCGDETFFIDQISDYIEHNFLTEGEKSFNQMVLYGRDIDVKMVIDEVRQYPMMSTHRVVIIKEAKDMKGFNDLLPYFEKPSSQCILVICYKYASVDKRTKLYKAIEANGLIFSPAKIYENALPRYVEQFCKTQGVTIDNVASSMIAEYLGNNLTKIYNEVEKMVVSNPGIKSITPEVVKAEIGNSRDYDIFDFQKALGQRDFKLSSRIIAYFDQHLKVGEMPQIITSLFNFYYKILLTHTVSPGNTDAGVKVLGINAFFVKDYFLYARNYPLAHTQNIIQAIKLADLQSKGVGRKGSTISSVLKEILICCMYNKPGIQVR
jgi:DNA polymerase III subunit delta